MTGAVLFSLVPAEPVFEIGEPIWLSIKVVNRGTTMVYASPESAWVDEGGLSVSVRDAEGQECWEPWRFIEHGGLGRALLAAKVAPGTSTTLWYDLARYAWLDAPGTYHVRLLAPVDRHEPPSAEDPRWLETDVVLVAPADPEAVVRAHPSTLPNQNRGEQPTQVDKFDGLGHASYVPYLEPYDDDRAIHGLGACPCPEATEVLLHLYDRADSPERRRQIQDELLRRTPWPKLNLGRETRTDSEFVARAWDTRLVNAVLERARRDLRGSANVPGWNGAYEWGAAMVGQFGDASDAALLKAAYDRALEGDWDVATMPRGFAVPVVQWAAIRHPGLGVLLSDDELELAQALHDIRGEPFPVRPDLEETFVAALTSDDPTFVQEAVFKLPQPPSTLLLASLFPHIGSSDRLVAGRIHRYLNELELPASVMRGPLFEQLATAEPWRVSWLLRELQIYVQRDEWLNLTLTKLSADPTNLDLVDVLLLGLSGCVERSRGAVLTEEVPRMVAAWMNALRTHDVGAAPLDVIPGETNPALAPSSFDCTLASGDTWPAR